MQVGFASMIQIHLILVGRVHAVGLCLVGTYRGFGVLSPSEEEVSIPQRVDSRDTTSLVHSGAGVPVLPVLPVLPCPAPARSLLSFLLLRSPAQPTHLLSRNDIQSTEKKKQRTTNNETMAMFPQILELCG